jgi:hypothetical protein
MRAPTRATLALGLAVAGHGLVLVGFFQPWVAGQFGARERLTGLDLVRITDGLIDHGLAGDALTLPITRVLLLAVPVAAANALLLLSLGRLQLIPRAHARHLALLLTLPVALVVLATHGLLLVSSGDESVIDGPAFGIFVATAGALLAVASWLGELPALQRRPEATAHPSLPASDGTVSEA